MIKERSTLKRLNVYESDVIGSRIRKHCVLGIELEVDDEENDGHQKEREIQ